MATSNQVSSAPPIESPLVQVERVPLRPKVLDLYEALFTVSSCCKHR